MLVNENLLTNPQIFCGTPPPYPFPPDPPKEALVPYWFAGRPRAYEDKDNCTEVNHAGDHYKYEKLWIKAWDKDWDPRFLPPKPPLLQGDPNYFYYTNQVALGPDRPGKGDSIEGRRTGVFVKEIGALISMPYYAEDVRFLRNLVQNHPLNVNPAGSIYFWQTDDNTKVRPMQDGSVFVEALSSRDSGIRSLSLPVLACEQAALPREQAANFMVNAFSIYWAASVGAEYLKPAKPGDPKPQPYVFRLKFGDVTFEYRSGSPSAKIAVQKTVHNVPFDPDRVVFLTFIPTWNGLIFTWGKTRNLLAQLESPHQVYVKYNEDIAFMTTYEKTMSKVFSNVVPRLGMGGINLPPKKELPDETNKVVLFQDFVNVNLEWGDTLTVEFERCGGAVWFAPIFFATATRTYIYTMGNNPAEDNLGKPCPEGPDGLPTIFPQNPVYRVDNSTVVPVCHYRDGAQFADIAFHLILMGDRASNLQAVEVKRLSPWERRPITYWGNVVAYYEPADPTIPDKFINVDGDVNRIVFSTQEGFLTLNDVPVPRIRRVSVSRSLTGSTGNIEWDRFDPVVGLFPRPIQNVGAIRIVVAGGQNIIPGVIFTGIGMGNTEEDSRDSNVISVPLFGRECKMTDGECGLRIFNAPFFDGFDHDDVLSWMANYVGVPFVSFALPYRLPVGTLAAPVVNIKSGTPVWDAMQEICKYSATLVYLDRFGVLRHYDVGETTGVNWYYPAVKVESYNDKPDLSSLCNTIVVAALVATGDVKLNDVVNPDQKEFNFKGQPMMVALTRPTIPAFAWSKVSFFAVPGIIQRPFLKMTAAKIASIVTRVRAQGSVTIPGNANIELLDTINMAWAVVQITHNVDLQSKTFSTNLQLEYLSGITAQDMRAVNVGAVPPGDGKQPIIGVNPNDGKGVPNNENIKNPPNPVFGG